ncbi:MAG: response regulator transcription factor [Chloroflexi bacterium]|nr:response regulator transcription factor [Chloroflexota bacterium]
MRILLIEDEEALRRAIRRVMTFEGHRLEEAGTGPDGLAMAVGGDFDVIILDVLLPGIDGIQVCKSIRAADISTPVLMLTALGEVDQRVTGLDAGADDYLAKPFAFEELLARIRALVRRGQADSGQQNTIACGQLTLDLLRRELKIGDRTEILTDTEFRLLDFLIRNAGQVIPRGRLLDAVWGYDFEGESNVVDIYIHYLRNKIGAAEDDSLIHTVRGVGYRLGR